MPNKDGIRKRNGRVSKRKRRWEYERGSGKGNWEGKVNEKDKEREGKERKRGVNKMKNLYGEKGEGTERRGGSGRREGGEWEEGRGGGSSVEMQRQVAQSSSHGYTSVSSVVIFNVQLPPYLVVFIHPHWTFCFWKGQHLDFFSLLMFISFSSYAKL
jgi:hypothetical protein